MAVMRGSEVKKLEHLIPNCTARSSGLLLDFEFHKRVVSRTKVSDPSTRMQRIILLALSGGRVLNPLRRIIYMVHHWQSPGLPDNSAGSKLRLIKWAINDDDFLWLDVWSLPRSHECASNAKSQTPSLELQAAIRSMQAYIFHSSDLIVIAPTPLDYEQLLGSAWCQTELFAAFCPVVRRESITSLGSSWSLCTRVLRHACKVDALVGSSRDQWHGGDELELIPLNPNILKDPMRCKIIDRRDLPLLQCALKRIRRLLVAAKAPDKDASQEVTISGVKESIIDGMLNSLSCFDNVTEDESSLKACTK